MRSVCAIACFAAFMAVSQAQALQITNHDATEQKITVTEKEKAHDLVVKPSEVLDGICNDGCTIKTSDGEEYEFDGNEVVSIEEGLMFLDEPSDAGAPDTGGESPATQGDGAEKKAK